MTTPPHPDHTSTPDNTPDTILVVGATGFIGNAVLTALTHHRTPHDSTPTLLALSRTPPRTKLPGVRYVAGDLTNPASLRGICSNVTTVVHAASYVGPDAHQCHRINHTGTRALLDEAQRHNVEGFFYISTTAVYGNGPHHGPRENQLTPAPTSPASTSRLLAEQDARAAGATILRPALIYGTGDRWFIPTLAHLLRHIPAWPEQPPPRTSAIAVDDLARITTALIHRPRHTRTPPTTYHVADPRPLPWNHLLTRLRTLLHLPHTPPIPLNEHRSLIRRTLPRLTDHQYALLTQDHWYNTTSVWHTTGLQPGPGFHQRLNTSRHWYTQHLAHIAQ
ncbi:NAD(P)-dependent oxidoreductase [Streptomyces griseoincarnatus]